MAFPVDPVGNGSFEAGSPPTGWTGINCTFTSENGTRTGGSGSKVGRIAYDGSHATGLIYQINKLTVGNRYSFDCWLLGANGAIPALSDGNVTIWTGAGTGAWEHATGTFTAANTYIEPYCANLSAGRYVDCDDFAYTCLNVSQATDLIGLGHHLLQATAASQPLWVASGAGGVLRFDGTNDWMKAAWALARPEHVFAAIKFTKVNGKYLWDGGLVQRGGLLYESVGTRIVQFAGAYGGQVSVSDATWTIYDGVYSATAQKLGINGDAQNVGAGTIIDSGGFTIGALGDGSGGFATQDVGAICVFNRELSESDRQRVIRWMRRQGRMLGVL